MASHNELCSDEEFIQLFTQYGAALTAKKLGTTERGIYKRRRRLEETIDRPIHAPNRIPAEHHAERLRLDIENGVVLVASDAHYWPGFVSTAHLAFLKACEMMDPVAVVMNGDAFDGAAISRWPVGSWLDLDRPTVEDELNACRERLGEIEDAGGGAKLYWPLGNHDARFESKLAAHVPEFHNVHGTSLKHHFPNWQPCWSLWINDDVVIKHRFKGGIHATHNNAMWAGKTVVTGHLHSLKVTPFSDYNGTRYGVDTGTLADPYGPQFSYGEDNPKNHRSGFAVLTFKDGRLMWPEVAHVVAPGIVEFRGKEWEV